ncbi:putative RNA recognition motif domain, nucleotide-binding alpha-beta plait domain superfamily [Helianthus debilis subsp. tardiflorus]
MGRKVWRRQNDCWNTLISKKEYRQEKKFANRENRLRNATTFFLSNLPDSCTKETMWQVYGHLDNVEDAFVPSKKDRAGNKFGFLKLSRVNDAGWWINMLKEIRIDGAVINVSLAKFNRDGSKIQQHNSEEQVSVFDRLRPGPKVEPKPTEKNRSVFDRLHHPDQASKPGRINGKPSHPPAGKSYRDVVRSKDGGNFAVNIEVPPLNSSTKKALEYKSLVGETKDIDILNDLQSNLSGITEDGFQLKYLGGLKVLLCFKSVKEAEEFHYHLVDVWEKWFSRLYVWDGLPPIFERVAWVKVIGVPVSLWDRYIFNKIGERCGRLLVKSEAEVNDGNLSEERLAVLVQSGKRINEEFNILWKDHSIKVWVEELSGQWYPAFLDGDVDTSDRNSTGESSELGDSISDESVDNPLLNDSSSQSLGIPPTGSVLEDVINDRVHVVHGENFSHAIQNNDERDKMGPDVVEGMERCSFGDPQNAAETVEREFPAGFDKSNDGVNQGGPDVHGERTGSASNRPGFITSRPKNKNKKISKPTLQAQVVEIPDLNDVAGDPEGSDPFNIEDIFRMEAEDARGVEFGNASPVPERAPDLEADLEAEIIKEVADSGSGVTDWD